MPLSGGVIPHQATHVSGGVDALAATLANATLPTHEGNHVNGGSDDLDSALDPAAMPTATCKYVSGTYTGDGGSAREIDIGGPAQFGLILGETSGASTAVWWLMKGAETKWTNPAIRGVSGAGISMGDENTEQLKSSANGFTLSAASTFQNNVNTNVYYYVMIVEV